MSDAIDTSAVVVAVESPGPPEALRTRAGSISAPGSDDIVIRQEAVGVNFHDIYVRSGAYRTMAFPGVPGIEGAGVVEWAGSEVSDFRVGDRVAYVTPNYGGYASRRTLPARQAVRIPDGIGLQTVAASFLKCLTAEMLLSRQQPVAAGSVVVVHAAAGGVGQLLVQMAKLRGAVVIGAAGSEQKARVAAAAGCDRVIVYGTEPLTEAVAALSGDRGADIVFDGVGAATFADSVACARPFGTVALFGQASGAVAAIDPALLAAKSLAVWRPVVFHHVAETARYRASAAAIFSLVAAGRLRVQEPTVLPLDAAAAAHRLLESRATTGSVVLDTLRRAAG